MSQKIGGVLIPFAVLQDKNLTWCERIVYSYFFAYQCNGCRCWESSASLSKKLSFSLRAIKYAVSNLLKKGYIKRVSWRQSDKLVSAFECLAPKGATIAPGCKTMHGMVQNDVNDGAKSRRILSINNKNKKASPDFEVSEKTKDFAERMGIAKDKLQ